MAEADTPVFSEHDAHVSGRRFVAHIADSAVLSVILIVLLIPAAIVSDILIIVVFILWFPVIHVIYFVLTQRAAGQSPGKRWAHIRVVDAMGRTPDRKALLRRTIPLLFEYFYAIAFIGMMSSRYRQRLGDRWADTYVIEATAARAGLPAAATD
jgi:uncharacterized RDD family membrane protein YckC